MPKYLKLCQFLQMEIIVPVFAGNLHRTDFASCLREIMHDRAKYSVVFKVNSPCRKQKKFYLHQFDLLPT